jgi:integrase
MAGRSSKGAKRYLDLRGHTWWFRLAIPAACKAHFGGKTMYMQNLETGEIRTAMARRDQLEPEVRKLFADIKAGRVVGPTSISAREAGRQWREALEEANRNSESGDAEPGEFSQLDIIMDAAEEAAERLSEKDRLEFTKAFAGQEAVDAFLDDYLRTADLTDKTKAERRGLVAKFARWAASERLTVSDVERKTAGQYVAEVIEPMHRSTAKKHLTALAGYWTFLNRRGHVARFEERDNPWRDQLTPERKRRKATRETNGEQDERPFTDEEVTVLLRDQPMFRRKPDRAMADMIKIAALSGMRISEICGLWVQECSGDVFDIQESKTEAGARRVPIHPELRSIVAKRIIGREGKAPLFAEVAGMDRPGDTMGKRFRRFRMALGVHDKPGDKRRSLVNFHSFRRWFVTKCEQAGIPETTVALVVGHEEGRKAITFGRYSGGAGERLMKECVEAVQLPTKASR